MMAEHKTTTKPPGPGASRQWAMRAIALLSPFLFIALLELSFRFVGAYEDDGWANPNVSFDESATPFPDWDEQVVLPKPQGTRMVTLGGSSTFGFGVDEPFAMLIEQQMSARWPDRHVEVINGGAHATGSHRVFEVLKRAAQFDMDVALVYMGHNEFLEEIFFDPEGFASRAEQVGGFARRLRVVNWLSKALSGLVGETEKPKMQRHFLGNTNFPLIRSEQQYALRLEFLESTLTQMIEFAEAHEIQIVVMPAIPNLLSAPGDSIHGPGYNAQPETWDELFAQSETMLHEALAQSHSDTVEARRWSEIVVVIDQLHAIDDQFAMSHFMLGQAWLAQGDFDRGVQALLTANRYDKRGDRAHSEVIEIILDTCAQRQIATVDMRDLFYSHLPAEFQRKLSGTQLELFLDHCHPTQQAHQMIADAFVQELVSNTE